MLGVLVFLVFFYSLFLNTPSSFQPGTVVRIESGASLRTISSVLAKQNIIRSRVAFEIFTILYDGEKRAISADYLFENRTPVWEVAHRIFKGERQLAPVKVTVPEGFNLNDIADLFSNKLENFSSENFLIKAKEKEGYLFPDTYFFFTTDNEDNVIQSMSANFDKKIKTIYSQITSSKRTEKDIIIMASIIEKEAKGGDDAGFIAGILWKRISIGMPLQVDASPETYKTKGLPKTPIGNPGLESIKAAISPISSPYLYYLHDKGGVIHYAKTFSEHKKNIAKYLK